MYATLAIAAVTGGTAVLASWVTSRGSTRAARTQAETAARAQRVERLRESRRAAYLDLIEQAHRMGELCWEISAVLNRPRSAQTLTELRELTEREVTEYGRLRRAARVVDLEGPETASAAALALERSTGPFYRAARAALAEGGQEPRGPRPRGDRREGSVGGAAEFDAAFRPFWRAVEVFIEEARAAHQHVDDFGVAGVRRGVVNRSR
ncbi:hypothetical protein ACFV3R_02510 [Streptomyces sp. NPDC059740]|uniref:hypothetical protein n=1 Tax=Streptomyces sp. NPDC059740 TaxID=3346926 RepID=UPI00366A10CC